MNLAVAAVSNGWWSRHGAHVLVIGIPMVLIATVAVWADVRAYVARRRGRQAIAKN
jgi:hypothetical protein